MENIKIGDEEKKLIPERLKPEIYVIYSEAKGNRSLKLAYKILAEYVLKKAGIIK